MACLKRFLVNIISSTSLFIFFIIISTGEVMATEQAKYQVITQDDNIEVRKYESHVVAETEVDSDFEDAGSAAFKRLFDYISGNNIAQKEIAMTTPVSQEASGEKIDMTSPVGQRKDNGRWAVSFMMPASYTYETLPQPKDPSIKLQQVPEQYRVSITYSGLWSESNYLSNKQKLEAWIQSNNYIVSGEATWARYNAPFTPWFLRRNEVLIPIEYPVNDI